MPIDPKLSAAQNFGNLSGNSTWNWTGTLNPNSTEQFYRFALSASSNFGLTLTNCAVNADLELRDSNGATIAVSKNPGALAESITRQLTAGTYYVRVSGSSPSTSSYNLGFRGNGAIVDPGDSLSSAFDLGTVTGAMRRSWAETVSDVDRRDSYRFQLAQSGIVNLALNDLTGDATLALMDSTGNQIAQSSNPSTSSEMIQRSLNAGTYYISVSAQFSTAAYRLDVTSGVSNAPPSNLQFSLPKSTYTNADTIAINNGWVYDANGSGEISRIDFRLQRSTATEQTWTDLSDVTSSSSYGNWAGFNYSLNLKGYTPANYTLWAIAYDKSGAMSNSAAQTFSVQASNQAPNSLQFTLAKSTFAPTETLTISNGLVYDANGAIDISRIDFRVLRPDQTYLDVSDVQGVTPTGNSAWGSFSYGLNLSGYAAGEYSLQAISYDKAGSASNLASQKFTVQVPVVSDWFSLNLKDKELIDLTRTLAKDGQLSRGDVITLFRNTEDGNVIDANELTDLRTIVSNASRFNLSDAVRVLSNKLVNGDVANQWYSGGSTRRTLGNLYAGSSGSQMENLIGKWFLGLDRPLAQSPYGETTYSYGFTNGALFQNGISYQDIKQGYVGDCYFLTGLGEVALKSPTTIQNMFIDNGDNTFTVRFVKNGAADYVTVDRYLPSTSWGTFVYANNGGLLSSNTNELWVALAEKAYAQLNESGWIGQDNTNSYQGLSGGWDGDAFRQVTGQATQFSWSLDFSAMVKAAQSGTLLGVSSKSGYVAYNVVSNHAYVVTGYNAATQKFSLFNPWGINGGVAQDGKKKDGTLELSWSELTASFDAWTCTV